jgi:hypothetical protein
MEPQDIHTIIAEMKYKNQITIRQKESLSWGNSLEVCRDLFMRIFCELDTTYDNPLPVGNPVEVTRCYFNPF